MKSKRARIVLAVAVVSLVFVAWEILRTRFGADAVLFIGESPVESIIALDPNGSEFAIHCDDDTAIVIADMKQWPAFRRIETRLAKMQLLAALMNRVLLVRTGDRLAHVDLDDPSRATTWGPDLTGKVVVGVHGRTSTVALASPDKVTFLRPNPNHSEFEKLGETVFKFDYGLAQYGFMRLIDGGQKLVSVSFDGDIVVIDSSTGTMLETASAATLLGPGKNNEEFHASVSVAAQEEGDLWILTSHSPRISVSALRTAPLRMVADMRARGPCFPAKAWAVSSDGTRIALVPFSGQRHVQVIEIANDNQMDIIQEYGLSSLLDLPTRWTGREYGKCSRLHFQSNDMLLVGYSDGTLSRQKLK